MSIENLEIIGLPETVVDVTAETTVPAQTGAENAMQANEGYGEWAVAFGFVAVAGIVLYAATHYKHPWGYFLRDR
ncbi:MAG: hypothetical protein KIH63_005250 [Candidatus Saccharibacteria bacterium]|nr:hypothetical protein [Candidatus Saccharibacteria bacterium]